MTEAAAGAPDAAMGGYAGLAPEPDLGFATDEGRWVLRLSDLLTAHLWEFGLIAGATVVLMPVLGWSYPLAPTADPTRILATGLIAALAGLAGVAAVVRPPRLRWDAVGLVPTSQRLLVLAALLGVSVQAGSLLVEHLLAAAGMHVTNPQAQVLATARTGTGLVGLVLVAGLLVPLAEELLHRGMWYGALRRYLGVVPAVLTGSAVFALLHGWNAVMPFAFVVGVVAALLYERGRSLWPAIAFHATLNVTAILLWRWG